MIGPVFFTLIQTSIERGFLSGVFVALGVSLSDVVYIVVAYFGVASHFEDAAFKNYLAHVGGAILVVFGLFSIIKKPKNKQEAKTQDSGNYFKSLLKGFVVNGLSPFVPIFWIGAVSLASVEHNFSSSGLVTFFAIVLGTVLTTDIAKAYLADKLRNLITQRFLRIMNIVVGIVLILFGGRLVFYEF